MRLFAKLTWVELELFVREPLNLVFTLGFPALVVWILGAAFGNVADPNDGAFGGIGPMDYYVPGYVGLAIASVGLIGIPVHLAGYRERGVLRRFRASGLPAWTLLAAQVVVTLVLAAAGSVVLITVGVLLYDVHAPKSPLLALVAFLLSALSFAAIGVLLAAVLPTARAAQGIGVIAFFVMMFLAGTDGPRALFGHTLRRIGDALPLTHVVTLLQNAWVGFAVNIPALLAVLGSLVVSAVLAVRFLRWQ
ncbi:ABC transporter permease [Nocardia huaxiensis]|uniref:Transport permease protein n=1 Tax=Nocardia huaxiensis TaxID=2755382 RepID=A0A7D6V6D1_9NOCA|nr:ABC transporter permease [Nocardia huaxiensis]QLY28581.1 ABC transporter permease [Nocardia huaxiensis]UFS97951.1 ABC transporter permease [Nocardia huaxiensis]